MKCYWDADATASTLYVWIDGNTNACMDSITTSMVSILSILLHLPLSLAVYLLFSLSLYSLHMYVD
jgi:hypothetical protein